MVYDLQTVQQFITCPENKTYIRKCQKLAVSHSADHNFKSSSASSIRLRQEANQKYKKREFHVARDLYNKSILIASEESEEIALAYASRSALCFETEEYKSAIDDVNNALHTGLYPQDKIEKLLIRKLNSLHKLLNSAPDEKASLLLTERIANLESQMMKEAEQKMGENALVSKELSSTVSSAVAAICMKSENKRGRYLEAVEDIAQGAVLISEEPFVFVLLPNFWKSQCYHCLQSCPTPIYCRKRCSVQYCSHKCSNDSWLANHQYECQVLDTVVNTGIGHLAYRIICTTPYNTLIKYKDSVQVSGVAGYQAVYDLVTNSESVLPADLHHYTKTAVLLLHCLLQTSFFPSEHRELTDDIVLHIGSLLLRHIQQLICNAHAITAMVRENTSMNTESTSEEKIASAVYPTTSLMNHSCKPNVISSFVGTAIVVKAQDTIPAGEEVYNCYGPYYARMPKAERQQALKSQYYFDCNCSECSGDNSPPTRALECPKCKGPAISSSKESDFTCLDCKNEFNAEVQIQTVLNIRKLLDEAIVKSPTQGITMANHAMTLAEGVLYQFSLDKAHIWDCMARCYANQEGSMKLCASSLEQSIAILKKIYGPSSVEIGKELHKLAEIYGSAQEFDKASLVANEAQTILSPLYPPNHETRVEVDKLCHQLDTVLSVRR